MSKYSLDTYNERSGKLNSKIHIIAKFIPLPLLILGATLFLNFSKFDISFPFAFFHILIQTVFVWALLVVFTNYKIARLILALFIGLELFTQLASNTSLSISMIMSVISASSGEVFSFLSFSLKAFILTLFFVLGLVFLPNPSYKPKFIGPFILGGAYVFLPVFLTAPQLTATKFYDSYIKTGLARGQSRTMTSVEFFMQYDFSQRFPAFKSIRGITDSIQFFSLQFTTSTSWTNVISKSSSPDIIILGIGESLRAQNMGLYGYERATTPFLSKLSGDLTVFKEAYSGGTNTWSSIPYSLTKVEQIPNFSKSIINLAKDAGYETFWLSNHAKISPYDFSISTLANQADHVSFSSDLAGGKTFDYSLVEQLKNTLASRKQGSKVFIILHFYGSHMSFSDRYPQEFSIYNDKNTLLNTYDNSVRYHDYIQNEVLEITSNFGGEYLYFADHGLGDPKGEIPLKHDVRVNPNLNSLWVPFFTTSQNGLAIEPSKPVSLYYFECIFSHWTGISAKELTEQNYCNSVLNNQEIHFVDSNLILHRKPYEDLK